MGRKLYAKGEGFNPTTTIDDVEGLREELDALAGSGGGDNTAIERRLTTAEGEIDDLQRDVAEQIEEVAAVGAKVNTLQGTDTGKSVRAIAAEETAKIVGNAPANYDTLKEIADYIATDATGAAELNNKINKNTTDIAKVAEDLSATHQLASNAESAILEVVELTIPAIESDVAKKATKTEAQGYATTAKTEANAYTDSEVEKLATVAPIAAGKIVKLTFGWTVSTLISFNATLGAAKDLFYYATYGTGTSVRTQYNFLHQSGLLKIYIDESNTGNVLYLHNTIQAGTMSVNNLIPSTVSIEEISAIPENATLIGDEKTLATLPDVRTRLGKTEKAADSAKLGGVSASDFMQKSGGTFTGDINAPKIISTEISSDIVNNRRTYSNANGYNIVGNPNSGWSAGVTLRDADGNANSVLIGAYGELSYEPLYIFIGRKYSAPLVKFDIANNRVIFDSKVGIGVTSPTEKLEVSGNVKATKFIGTLQGNADSATKLATARKIWGQSFDGSGNVDGDMEVNGDVVIKGNVVIEGNITSGASYQSNPLSTISEGEVPSVEQQLRAQISSLEERIATLERIIAQNNG